MKRLRQHHRAKAQDSMRRAATWWWGTLDAQGLTTAEPVQPGDTSRGGEWEVPSTRGGHSIPLRAQSLEASSRGALKAALRDYAQRTELALSSTERRLAEVTEAAAVLLKCIEIAQYHLECMSWWDHLWTMLRHPPAAYRLWVTADGEVDEAFAAMERALHDSSEPGPSERQRMRRDIATAYGRIIDLVAMRRRERRRVAKVVVSDMAQELDPLHKRRLSKA